MTEPEDPQARAARRALEPRRAFDLIEGSLARARNEADRCLPNLLTVAEVAKLLRTSVGSVYWHAEQGKLPGAIKLGRRLLFDGDVLAKHIDSCRITRKAPTAEVPRFRVVRSSTDKRAPRRKGGEA